MNAITGEPEVIENPLNAENVEIGRLLWYHGFTSTFRWNCPAIITWVDKKARVFRVRSMDDMLEQDQEYDFDFAEGLPYSRKTMRVASETEVEEYLRGEGKTLADIPDYAAA